MNEKILNIGFCKNCLAEFTIIRGDHYHNKKLCGPYCAEIAKNKAANDLWATSITRNPRSKNATSWENPTTLPKNIRII